MPDPTPPPRYLDAVLAAAADAPRGRVSDVFVLHDDSCPLLLGTGPCACDPTVSLGFVLWHRPRRGKPWTSVATCPTEAACFAAIATSGRKGGDWLTLPSDKEPN